MEISNRVQNLTPTLFFNRKKMFSVNLMGIGAGLIPWFLSHGLRIVIVLIVAFLANRFGKIFIEKAIRKAVKSDSFPDPEAEKKREDTLIRVFSGILSGIIWLVAILTILPEFGINIGPLLAGVGIVGLAIGLGARALIQDYLAGLFILLEDQYRVDEEVEIAGKKGKVIDLNLRRTALKDSEGKIHYIPNGQVKTATNFSRSRK